jgi:Double-GTPase 2
MPLVLLVAFCLVAYIGLYGGALMFVGGGVTALGIGAVEFVGAAFLGFTPAGSVKHLRIDPPPEHPDGPDPAYRSYYAGPVLLDYKQVLTQAVHKLWSRTMVDKYDQHDMVTQRSLMSTVWTWTEQSDSVYWKAFIFPVSIGAAVGLISGMVAAFGLVAVTSVIFGLLLMAMVLGALITAGASRTVELGLLFIRGITVECGVCHVRVTRQIYRCPTCDAAHRHLVPGISGVLHRTCRCGATLPTLLALGKAKLPAQCGECQAQLPVKSLTAPTVHIPVIAGPAAGKSVYMQTAITRLIVQSDEDGGGFEFADASAKAEFERNVQAGAHQDPSRVAKTVVKRPRAYNVFVGKEKSQARRLLYLYDPAGETMESVERLAGAQYLSFTKGIVFIVDAFSLRAVRSATDRATLMQVKASNTAPKPVLERFVESLRERLPVSPSKRLSIPIAVVVTKTDGLLDLHGIDHPYAALGAAAIEPSMRVERDRALRAWLSDVAGHRDLLSTVDNQFSTVAYFAVSYQDALAVSPRRIPGGAGAVTNDDPATPLLWLLNRKGHS